MGKQKGLVHLTGQYGDVQLSINANGTPIAKYQPRTSGKRVKQDANFALTRRNDDEFTGCAYAASALRLCMGERIKQFSDRNLYTRLVAVMHGVKAYGTGMAGQRSLEIGPNGNMLQRIDADKRTSLRSRLAAPFTVTANVDRNTATLNVPVFDAQNFLSPPQGATHFRLLVVAGVLSDYTYVGGSEVYAPVNPGLKGLVTTATSATLPAYGLLSSNLTLVAALPGGPILPSTASLVVSVGIEYLRVINTYEEVMASGNALQIVEVF